MTEAWTDEPLDALAWFEGLQLLPQHFQQWDRRIERIIARHASSWMGYGWGIDRVEWDGPAIGRGRLHVMRTQGVFPDGLVFNVTPSAAGGLECELPGEAPVGTRLRYALSIPRQNFVDRGARVGRFAELRSRLVSDWRDMDERATVMFEAPNISVRAHDASALYTQLPFIELERSPSGWIVCPYHPPAVELFAGSQCLQIVRSLAPALRRLLQKLQPFAAGRESVPMAAHIFAALCPMLGSLEALSAMEQAHPFQWHLLLSEVAGAVGAANTSLPPAFSGYDHADPAHTLLALASYINAGLARLEQLELRPVVWEEQPFAVEAGMWWCDVPSGRPAKITLQLDFDELNAEARAWIDHTLICAQHDVTRCRERRIRGLPRQYLETFSRFQAIEGRCYVQVDAPHDVDSFRLVLAAPDRRTNVRLRHVHLLRARGTA